VESLLSIHQSLVNPKNGIDDQAWCERDIDGRPGRQKASFGNTEVSFLFDGSNFFLSYVQYQKRSCKLCQLCI
jgi:hypothetical protein